MNSRQSRRGVVRHLILGALLGALATLAGISYYIASRGFTLQDEEQRAAQTLSVAEATLSKRQKPWPPEEYTADCRWSYLKVDEGGWSTAAIGTFEDLGTYFQQPSSATHEIAIPVFPTVYQPAICDKLYYDAIWESEIQEDDKVLVIGTGSGADAWMVSLKTQQPVYVVEVNPMAVVNARATAQLAGFEIRPIVGDVIEVELPEAFRDFDYVLWNMPFLHSHTTSEQFGDHRFHDGDDGTILKAFLKMLPSLLNENGQAILLNYATAAELISGPGVEKTLDPDSPEHEEGPIMLFKIADANGFGRESP